MSTTQTVLRAGGTRSRSAGPALGRAALLTPGVLLLFVCAFLPLIAIVVSGFLDADDWPSLENIVEVFSTSTYLNLLVRTLLVSVAVTVVSIIIGWPAAWALAHHTPQRMRQTILALVIIPFITSQLLLIYGFLVLIQPGGPLANLTAFLHLTADTTESIAYTPLATFLMLVYESLPTAILVMYGASSQVDTDLVDAARSLGAGTTRRLLWIIWPLCAPTIIINFTLTFVMTVGAFAEPAVLGGPDGQMIGNTIESFLSTGRDNGFPIALSLVLLLLTLVIVGIAGGLVSLVLRVQNGAGGFRSGTGRARTATPGAPAEEIAS